MSDEAKFGLSASAKLEVKTEVPSEASGRVVHAMADAVSPLTEWLGLQGDKLRIHRKAVVQKLLKKANEQLASQQQTPQPVPTKIVVPLLENASQEELDDEFMVDRWAALLVSSTKEGSIPPYFVGLLRDLNSRQGRLLMEFALCLPATPYQQEKLGRDVLATFKDPPLKDLEQKLAATKEIMRLNAVYPVAVTFTDYKGKVDRWDFQVSASRDRELDLQILESLQLIRRSGRGGNQIMCEFITLSLLGERFIDAVHGQEPSGTEVSTS
jgi:hypothetical protein